MCSFITPAHVPTCNIMLKFVPRRGGGCFDPGLSKRGQQALFSPKPQRPFQPMLLLPSSDQVTLIKAFIECLGMCGMACLSTESRNELTHGPVLSNVQSSTFIKSKHSGLFTISHFYTWVLEDIEAFKTFFETACWFSLYWLKLFVIFHEIILNPIWRLHLLKYPVHFAYFMNIIS